MGAGEQRRQARVRTAFLGSEVQIQRDRIEAGKKSPREISDSELEDGRSDELGEACRHTGVACGCCGKTEASVRDLDAGGRRKLTSVLAARLVEQHAAPEALDILVADRYWIEPDQIYAHDLEAYVNSCDRLGQEGLGMAVCLGDREALSRAEKLLDEYTSKVLGYLVSLESKGLFPKKHIQFFYCDDASLAGVVAGTGMLFFFDQTRPTLGLSVLDGVTKVSARGTRALIAAGVDLAAALREAASEVSGNGGGHNIASGATVPKGKEDRFLTRVDEIVGRQLEAARANPQ